MNYHGTTELGDINETGELVWAAVLNPFENRKSKGKLRPVVLIERVDGHWRAMGLTTNSTYAGGVGRRPIPDVVAVGLQRPGYLWASHLTNVSVMDIRDHIGWADESLVEAIVSEVRITDDVVERLHHSADAHHGTRTDC